MKRMLYLISIFILASCANNRETNVEKIVESADDYDMEVSALQKPEAFDYQNVYSEKLQSYFDLLNLYSSHPNFREDIELQLKKLSTDPINPLDTIPKVIIGNVQISGKPEVVSDAVTKTVLRFNKNTNGIVVSDSITAIVMKKLVLLGDTEEVLTTVRFSKF